MIGGLGDWRIGGLGDWGIGRLEDWWIGGFFWGDGRKAALSVKAALKSLADADLVYRTDAGYIVYDRLFGIWLLRLP